MNETPFLKRLFDLSFRTFITRNVIGVLYALFIIVETAVIIWLMYSNLSAVESMRNQGYLEQYLSEWTLFWSLVPPIALVIAIVLVRVALESIVAIVTIAENTKK